MKAVGPQELKRGRSDKTNAASPAYRTPLSIVTPLNVVWKGHFWMEIKRPTRLEDGRALKSAQFTPNLNAEA